MHAEDGIHRKLPEQAILDHHIGAAFRLLGRLKNEMDAAVKFQTTPVFGQVARRAEQHGGMPVMTAGVHLAGVPGAMRKLVVFLQRQGVHVGAQADGTPTAALAQDADDPGFGQATMDFEAIGGKLTRHDVGCPCLLEGQFGVGVDITAQGGYFREKTNVQ